MAESAMLPGDISELGLVFVVEGEFIIDDIGELLAEESVEGLHGSIGE
jgi:hypothetical protein